jgi:hypothetical protein
VEALHDYVLNGQEERKVLHHWQVPGRPEGLPEPVQRVLQFGDLAKPLFNSALTKRYLPEDRRQSGSFRWHRDPEHYRSGDLSGATLKFVTLGGYAIFFAKRDEADMMPVAVACRPNTIIAAHEDPLHHVTPPMNMGAFDRFCETSELDDERDGVGAEPRTLLFVGIDYLSVPTPALRSVRHTRR